MTRDPNEQSACQYGDPYCEGPDGPHDLRCVGCQIDHNARIMDERED